ncbi:unnamed protein product, partial [Didymodactylos carnosus]
ILQCLNRLNEEETNPTSIYEQWISGENVDSNSRAKIITGFSGTNDTQLLLPSHIPQSDLPELQKTDALVVNNLLTPNNENYKSLPKRANSKEILKHIVENESMINVILDVGALFVDGTNHEIAIRSLNMSNKDKIDYDIYFESDSIVVCDRQHQQQSFFTSPASERLDRCLIYLDEVHTRGTDFKFPNGFLAAVTMGDGLTKDRFVQECMRMRKFGLHHWLTFLSPNDVDQQIWTSKRNRWTETIKRFRTNQINTIDILLWVYENIQRKTWDGLNDLAAQSMSYQRKMVAYRSIQWMNEQQSFSEDLQQLTTDSLEAEVLSLMQIYSPWKTP